MTLSKAVRGGRLLVDHAFRSAFKSAAFERRYAIADALESIFDLPDDHPLRGPTHSISYCGYISNLPPAHPLREELLHRYGKMPNLEQEGLLQFDAAVAKRRLRARLAQGAYSIVDLAAPEVRQLSDPGSVQFLAAQRRFADERAALLNSPDYPTLDVGRVLFKEDWSIQRRMNVYWNDVDREDEYQALSNFAMYCDREPKSLREKYHVDGGLRLFDLAATLAYHERLITFLFPSYMRMKKVSDRKTRRYAKRLKNGLFLGLYARFSFLESELRMGYVELPELSVEVFDDSVERCLSDQAYTSYQTDHAIARIRLAGITGHPEHQRIGYIGDPEDDLKGALFFHSDVSAHYLRIHLSHCEQILEEVVK
jgi:hypothetical protein